MYCKCPQQFLRFWNVRAWPLEMGSCGGMLLHDLCVEKAEGTLSMFFKDRKKFLIGIYSIKFIYLFRTTWIIHRLFWLLSNYWELILNSLNLPSLLICFLSVSCSLMMCRRVLTLLFYFIVRIFLFCVCLYMYVCTYILNHIYIMSIL